MGIGEILRLVESGGFTQCAILIFWIGMAPPGNLLVLEAATAPFDV